jgi:hypothetical protein
MQCYWSDQAKLTSAALAAACLASSGLGASSLPPRVRPGVLVVTFLGTGVVVALGVCEDEPSVRPGVEKFSGWLEDLEQMLPILAPSTECRSCRAR